MTDKELKRLSRAELLEMLLAQAEENEKLKTRLGEMQTRLDNRQIMLAEAGSIAEAALQLNGVFQAAESAAAQYLENIRRLSSEKEAVCRQTEAEKKVQSLQEEPEADRCRSEAEKKVQDLTEKQEDAPAPRRSRRRGRKKK